MSEKKAARILILAVVLCLIVGMAPAVSAASVTGAVSPSGVLDLTDIGYTVVDAGLPDRMRLKYAYKLDKSPCYWITKYSDDVGVSYTDGTTSVSLTDVDHYVFPSGNAYVKLPFDPGIMSNISIFLRTGLKMGVNATGKQYRWVEIDFFDSGFNLISTYKSEETSYSLSYSSSVSNVGVTVSGLSIPEGAVYMFPRLGLRRSLSYSTIIYQSGVYFTFQCDVANEFAPVAITPVVESSFAGQTIQLELDQTAKLSLFAGSINGIAGVIWQHKLPDDAVWTTMKTDTLYHDSVNNLHYGAWEYIHDAANGPLTVLVRATVTNTVGDNIVSVNTEPATLVFGGGASGDSGSSGDTGETLGKLEEVEADIQEVQEDVQAVMDAVNDLPDKVADSMEQVQEQEKQEANDGGNENLSDLTDAIPDYSEGFMDALRDFASSMIYSGTDAVLPIPAIVFPEIGGLVPSFTLLEANSLDFGQVFQIVPDTVMKLVQALFTIALIVYCFKELYGTISYVLTLRGGGA